MWRLSGRPEVLDLMRSARRIAHQIVEPLVASGDKPDHSWTDEKARMLRALDDDGLTLIVTNSADAVALPLACSLWELAWIDGGAAVCALSGALAQMVIRDFGTSEQRARYLQQDVMRHGALCLTEPLPGAGSDATLVDGRIGIAEWRPGEQPMLEVEKRGRFTSHMDFADFVLAAVDSRDARFRGSCLVILEPAVPFKNSAIDFHRPQTRSSS
jgi:alkylation response protein AidB-like acyl-CoA dehydrogenase